MEWWWSYQIQNIGRNHIIFIQDALSSIFDLDDIICWGVMRPIIIKKGFKIHINIDISNTKAIDMNIQKEIKESNDNGESAEIIQDERKLSSPSTISNAKY